MHTKIRETSEWKPCTKENTPSTTQIFEYAWLVSLFKPRRLATKRVRDLFHHSVFAHCFTWLGLGHFGAVKDLIHYPTARWRWVLSLRTHSYPAPHRVPGHFGTIVDLASSLSVRWRRVYSVYRQFCQENARRYEWRRPMHRRTNASKRQRTSASMHKSRDGLCTITSKEVRSKLEKDCAPVGRLLCW